jgi:hypothetical protein
MIFARGLKFMNRSEDRVSRKECRGDFQPPAGFSGIFIYINMKHEDWQGEILIRQGTVHHCSGANSIQKPFLVRVWWLLQLQEF